MSWTTVRIGDHCEITSSKRIFLSDYVDAGIPFWRSKEVIEQENGQSISDPLFITHDKYEEIKNRFGVPKPGDMLLTSVGTIGIPFIVKSTSPFYFKDGNLTWFRNFAVTLSSRYLYYWIKSNTGHQTLNNLTIGSSQKALTIENLKNAKIPLPDLPTQRRIASILSAYDDLIENNRRQIKLLEEAAQRLYREWFVELRFPGHEGVKVVDGVPEGWMKGTLNTIAEFTGKKANKAERERYKCYLPIDCLPKKSLAYINHDNISNAESSLLSFAKYDIIFGAMRPYFHKVVIAQEEGLTRSTCFVINSRSKEYWSYVCMLLFSEEAIDYATHVSVGTTMPYVRWKDFERMPVLIPSQKVAAHFHEMLLPIIQKISCIAKHIALLSEARDRLLPKLMSGEMEASE